MSISSREAAKRCNQSQLPLLKNLEKNYCLQKVSMLLRFKCLHKPFSSNCNESSIITGFNTPKQNSHEEVRRYRMQCSCWFGQPGQRSPYQQNKAVPSSSSYETGENKQPRCWWTSCALTGFSTDFFTSPPSENTDLTTGLQRPNG